MWRQKLQTLVDFPLEDLNMRSFRYHSTTAECQNQNINLNYNLEGVVNHYGTLEGGHYTAYCKNDSSMSRKWWRFDDHEVTDISVANVKSQSAYVLFYSAT